MAKYIDKSALVAEIERRIADNKKDIERASHKNLEDYFEGYEDALVLFKEKFLNTLEVKEVDLETELDAYIKANFTIDKNVLDKWGIEEKDYMYSMDKSDILKMIRHFANWQKQQMMEGAVEAQYHGNVLFQGQTFVLWDNKDLPFKAGDKVKVIII